MNDLHTWLSQQHHGLRTFRAFQQKLDALSEGAPEQRALCRVLSGIVGSYAEAFDEEPCRWRLPTAPTIACSISWQAWISAQARTGGWPTSTGSRLSICGIDRGTEPTIAPCRARHA